MAQGLVPAFAKASPRGIVLVATNQEKLKTAERAVHDIDNTVRTLSVAIDVSDEKAVSALFGKVKAAFGHADVLINGAGVNGGGGNIHEEDSNAWW